MSDTTTAHSNCTRVYELGKELLRMGPQNIPLAAALEIAEKRLVETKLDSARLDRLEEAEWFSLYTLSDGRKLLKIQIHKDAMCYLPKAGSMTVRELMDNEEKVFQVLEEDHE